MNQPKHIDWLLKNLMDKIQKIDKYVPDGPIEAKDLIPSKQLFYEQKKINQEIQEEKSEKGREENSRGINGNINV